MDGRARGKSHRTELELSRDLILQNVPGPRMSPWIWLWSARMWRRPGFGPAINCSLWIARDVLGGRVEPALLVCCHTKIWMELVQPIVVFQPSRWDGETQIYWHNKQIEQVQVDFRCRQIERSLECFLQQLSRVKLSRLNAMWFPKFSVVTQRAATAL